MRWLVLRQNGSICATWRCDSGCGKLHVAATGFAAPADTPA